MKRGPAEERLREYVRERVSKDGDLYDVGAAHALAVALDTDDSWVSKYLKWKAHANLDRVIAICDFYGISVQALSKPKPLEATTPAPAPAPPPDPLVLGLAEALAQPKADRLSALWGVNIARTHAGLPAIEQKRARRIGRPR